LANFIVFLSLFSLVEAPFHFRDISRGSQDSSFFVRLEDKNFFQKATETWQAKKNELDADEFAAAQAKNELLSPAEEHGLVLSNIENADGFVTHRNFDGDYIKIKEGTTKKNFSFWGINYFLWRNARLAYSPESTSTDGTCEWV
jgi:hypothetical protein